MKVVEEIRKKLKSHPEINYEEGENSIIIFPVSEEGFTVEVIEHASSCTVAFEGWHESFESTEKALGCVGFGLSEACRLKTLYRDKFPQKWIVEYKENGKWVEGSETVLLFFPFWRKSRVVYKQNHVVKET